MSARVLNPTVMSEISRSVGGGARVAPSRAALARVRRDLFGPVDHAAARALAESELRAQSLLDAERWGFDFRLEMPRENSRYEWRIVGPQEIVPEPYALRGMSYIRAHAPPTPSKSQPESECDAAPTAKPTKSVNALASIFLRNNSETTPPHSRVPANGDATPDPKLCVANSQTLPRSCETTPITRKQSSITDFMKRRKRTLNGSSKKSIMEPAEKVSRSAAKIRS